MVRRFRIWECEQQKASTFSDPPSSTHVSSTEPAPHASVPPYVTCLLSPLTHLAGGSGGSGGEGKSGTSPTSDEVAGTGGGVGAGAAATAVGVRRPRQLIVAVTANGAECGECGENGFDEICLKPLAKHEIYQIINRYFP